MSFEAELSLEGNTYSLNSLTFNINQQVDELGRPSSASRGGFIKVEMDTLKDDLITSWVIDPNKQLNGRITFYKTDEYAKLKEISFENGYCVELREKYLGAAFADRMVTLLTISSENVILGSIKINNQWLG